MADSVIDLDKPSLFELLSETQLRELLEPSLRYLLAITTQRHPRYLIHILNRWDEAYALLMLLVERHYLTKHAGTFTENFYGLKRSRAAPIPLSLSARHAPSLVSTATKLSQRDIWTSLAVIVGVPYLKRKLDDAYEIHSGGAAANLLGAGFRADELPADATTKQKAKHYAKLFLRQTYPAVNAAYYFSALAYNLLYLFGRSDYHTPFDHLIRVRMRRLTEADMRAAAAPPAAAARPHTTAAGVMSMFAPSVLTRIILPKILDSLRFLLPTSIFFLKFLEWWHASDFARQLNAKTSASIELAPPVPVCAPPPPEEEGVGEEPAAGELENVRRCLVRVVEEDTGVCPICKREIVNATAVQTGYVFCYPCVFRWVQDGRDKGGEDEEADDQWRKGRCPVTGVKLLTGTEGLRRLMI